MRKPSRSSLKNRSKKIGGQTPRKKINQNGQKQTKLDRNEVNQFWRLPKQLNSKTLLQENTFPTLQHRKRPDRNSKKQIYLQSEKINQNEQSAD